MTTVELCTKSEKSRCSKPAKHIQTTAAVVDVASYRIKKNAVAGYYMSNIFSAILGEIVFFQKLHKK